MKPSPHLLVVISSHGFGHLAQCAPVINALYQRLPEMRLTVCSGLPEGVLRERLHPWFEYRSMDTDPGMPMSSAWEVDAIRVREFYAGYHHDREERAREFGQFLCETSPDLVLANIPYLVLAVAHQMGFPAIALCSLNWASIYAGYVPVDESDPVFSDMLSAYRAADLFLIPQPGLPMQELPAARSVGPIARIGRRRRPELTGRLKLSPTDRLVMVGLGGIPAQIDYERWPGIPGVRWLLPRQPCTSRQDMTGMDNTGLPFIDVLASCDAIVTKPGYGVFVEAACNATPVLTVERPDWPETPFLVDWLKQHGNCGTVTAGQLHAGDLSGALTELWCQPVPTAPHPCGIEETVDILLDYLHR